MSIISFFSNLFKMKDDVDFATLLQEGAIIIDVRTKSEYKDGHIKGSINMPLDELNNLLVNIKKDKTIITVCQSGMRSKMAAGILKKNGFDQVYNGGSWVNFK